MTLEEAIAKVNKKRTGRGAPCPCCCQKVVDIKHDMKSDKTDFLVELAKEPRGEWIHLGRGSSHPLAFKDGKIPATYNAMRHWYVIEQQGGKGNSGKWRVTPYGREFIDRKVAVFAWIKTRKTFDGRTHVTPVDWSDEKVFIDQVPSKRARRLVAAAA